MKLSKRIFRILISVYPKPYKHFEESLLQTFDDMHEDASVSDWFIVRDTVVSIPMQYINYFEETMQTKFKNIPAAIIGAILVLPFAALIAISVSGQLMRDFGFTNSWNDAIGQAIGANSTHWHIGIAILFVFPIAAFLINLIALIWVGFKEKGLTIRQFVMGNVFSIVILFVGIGFALFIPFHDAVPCVVHGIWQNGFSNLLPLIRTCRNA